MKLATASLLVATLTLASSGCGSDSADEDSTNTAGSSPTAAAGTAPPPMNQAAGNGNVPVAGTTSNAGTMAATGGTVAGAPVAGASQPNAGNGGSSGTGPVAGTGSTGGASADWTMIGYDVASTYNNTAETVLTKENAASLAELWSVDMGGNVYSVPLQVGDKIYAAGPGTVRAFDAASGNELWKQNHASSASLAYANGRLYLNNNDASVVALSAEDGSMVWTKQPGAQQADGSSSPVPAGDMILIGGSNGSIELAGGTFRGYLAALDQMTGDVHWLTPTVPEGADGASIWSSPSADVAAGFAYGSTGNNYGTPATDTSDSIIQFNLMTGAIVWKNQRTANDTFGGFGGGGPDYDFGANPVLYETMVDGVMTQVVSAGAKSGAAHGLNRADGTELWTRDLCGPGSADGSRGIFVSSTWTGKHMLFGCNTAAGATLFALDGATGAIAWMQPLPGQVWGRISVANGVGFVGAGTTLVVFDVDTGAEITTIASKGGTVAGTVSIANGRVAFGVGLSWSSGVRGTMLTVLGVK